MDHWVRRILADTISGRADVPDYILEGLGRISRIIEELEPYHCRTEKMDRLADELSVCTELSELSRLMWNATILTGFDNFIIFLMKSGANGPVRSRICSSCSSDWIKRYQSRRYQFIDPVLAAAMSEDGIFEFAKLKNNSPATEDFWADSEAHRIGRNGICISQTCSGGARIGVSFLTSRDEIYTRETIKLNGSDLLVIASLAIEAFFYASYGCENDKDALTLEELRFLYIIATEKDPYASLRILPKYGSNRSLQASIRRKLGVETVFQAVAKAAACGYFDEVPYDASEVVRPFPNLVGFGDENKFLEEIIGELSDVHDEGPRDFFSIL